ncbi:LysR family transcriptional regulator [Agaricicola taiwanensis]|uniref:LysR family transcriptional regulator n=1 Tax=Agaricicola taiwanensis TaxID=591372 RepID=A0A8J3DZP9_9RHOB|nr:LysR family transcriptional regulator [Agaricicola taiwanensis]GGE51851.1 LysR family transcriptional regulator [Agaricicola taiwanensis]
MRQSVPRSASESPAAGEESYVLPSFVTLRLLTILVAIDETGSLSGAAKRLGMTQSAISQAVLAFEDMLGKSVFDRSLRPSAFTLTGRLILKHATPILDLTKQLEHALRFSSQTQLSVLRIGILDTFATTVGPFLMEEIRPIAASWSIASGSRETKINALIEHRADMVITSDETPCPPHLTSRLVLSEPYFLVLPRSQKVSFTDLATLSSRMDFIRYGQGRSITRQIDDYLKDNGVIPPHTYQFDGVDAVIGMVAAGLGWAIATPLSILKARDKVNELRCEPLPGPQLFRTISLVSHDGEAAAIAERIRLPILRVLRERTLPELLALLPHLAKLTRIEDAS